MTEEEIIYSAENMGFNVFCKGGEHLPDRHLISGINSKGEPVSILPVISVIFETGVILSFPVGWKGRDFLGRKPIGWKYL